MVFGAAGEFQPGKHLRDELSVTRTKSWAATAVVSAIIALSSWAISSPVGSSPDDDFHNVSIWCGQGLRSGVCEQGSTPETVLVPETVFLNSSCFAFQFEKSGLCEESLKLGETDRVNLKQELYPQAYYWTMSWLVTEDISASIIAMRIVNLLLAVLALTVAVVYLPRHLRRVPIVSITLTSIPLTMFIIPSVNPSSWSIVSVLLFFSAMLGLLVVKDWPKRIIFVSLALLSFAMGTGSRADTPAYLLFAACLAIFLTVNFGNISRIQKLLGLGAALATSLIFFVVFILPLFKTIFSGEGGLGAGPTDIKLSTVVFNLLELPYVFVGAFGLWALGWLDTPIPPTVWAITFGLYFAVLFAALRSFDRRQKIAILVVLAALVVVPMYFLSVNNLKVGEVIQPRYLLPLLGLVVSVALFRKSIQGGLELSRSQVWLIGFGLFIGNLISLQINLRRYLTGLDVSQLGFDFEPEWWWVAKPASGSLIWFSPNYLWILGVMSFGLLLVSLWKLRSVLGLPGSETDDQRIEQTSSQNYLNTIDAFNDKSKRTLEGSRPDQGFSGS